MISENLTMLCLVGGDLIPKRQDKKAGILKIVSLLKEDGNIDYGKK
ncbi:MAG: hypothetical protein Q7J85_10600 [Bacillota bacterium]|nr:hypothetical protein [Bacillota bacterium]